MYAVPLDIAAGPEKIELELAFKELPFTGENDARHARDGADHGPIQQAVLPDDN
jgi:hypothetical protein